jgi:hypothetical protein
VVGGKERNPAARVPYRCFATQNDIAQREVGNPRRRVPRCPHHSRPFAVTPLPPQEKRNAPGVFDTGRALIAPFHYDFVGGFMDAVSLSSSTCLVHFLNVPIAPWTWRICASLNYAEGGGAEAGAAGWVA